MITKMLVFVDDDPDDQDLIEDGLKTLQIDDCLVLNDAHSFYAYLLALQPTELPKAIVLDINMPGLGGIAILRQLKADTNYQQIPVYIFTCASNPGLKEQCFKEGAAGYYIKPDVYQEIRGIINDIYQTVVVKTL